MRKGKMEGELATRGPGDWRKIRLFTTQVRTTHVIKTWADRGGMQPEILQFRLVQPLGGPDSYHRAQTHTHTHTVIE